MLRITVVLLLFVVTLPLALSGARVDIQQVDTAEARALRERAAEKAYAVALEVPRLIGRDLRRNPTDINTHLDRAVDTRPTPSNQELLTESFCENHFVAVATVTAERGFLTTDATYILTEYTLSISQQLRGTNPGREIRYVRPGGRMYLRDRWVRATDDVFPLLELGGEYIVFLSKDPGTDFFRSRVDSMTLLDVLEVKQGRVFDSHRHSPGLRQGVELPAVVNAVRGAFCRRGL